MEEREELNAELRKARNWLIGVGILMFIMDAVFIYGLYGDMLLGYQKTQLIALSGGILCSGILYQKATKALFGVGVGCLLGNTFV